MPPQSPVRLADNINMLQTDTSLTSTAIGQTNNNKEINTIGQSSQSNNHNSVNVIDPNIMTARISYNAAVSQKLLNT